MKNPIYAGDFQAEPRPDRIISINAGEENPILSAGIKTITHNRSGMKLHPHKVVAIEMIDGEEVYSFGLPAKFARDWAAKVAEYADVIEKIA